MSSNNSNSGMDFWSWLSVLLTVLFVGLKLTGHIAWSWWWVFSPIWGGIVLALGILALIFIGIPIVAGVVSIFIALIGSIFVLLQDKIRSIGSIRSRGNSLPEYKHDDNSTIITLDLSKNNKYEYTER